MTAIEPALLFSPAVQHAHGNLSPPADVAEVAPVERCAPDHPPDGGLESAKRLDEAPPELRDGICLTVSDDGCGMTPEVLERLFDPFFTTEAPGEYSGLGLSVVYGIVSAMGGVIKVDSSTAPVGGGTRFHAFIEQMAAHPRCRTAVPSETHLAETVRLCRAASATGKLVADAQHAALAISDGCTWVTRDRDFSRFEQHGLCWQRLVLE
jgi:hypothetical protein